MDLKESETVLSIQIVKKFEDGKTESFKVNDIRFYEGWIYFDVHNGESRMINDSEVSEIIFLSDLEGEFP